MWMPTAAAVTSSTANVKAAPTNGNGFSKQTNLKPGMPYHHPTKAGRS